MSDAPEIIREMNPEAFKAHKYHPQSVIFRTYLSDFRAALIRDHSARWLENAELTDGGEDEARFRAAVIQDILDLEPETIRSFYFGDESPAENADLEQAIQDQPKVIEEET